MAIPTMTNNSPIAGSIAWGAFTIQLYGVAYSVPAASSTQRWVWWEYKNGSPILNSGPDVPTTLTDDDLVLFANKNGIGVRVQSTNFVDGELLVDGSIFADALSTNLINSQHIVTAGLDAGVIKFGRMHGDRIEVGTLQSDRIIVGNGDPTPLWQASQDKAAAAYNDAVKYLLSKGTDLVSNGTGILKTNQNFSQFNANLVDVPDGATTSFYSKDTTYYARFIDEMIPFDPSKQYDFSFKMRQTVAGATNRAYGFLAPFDADGLSIQPNHTFFWGGTTTTLAAPLNNGDTTVQLTSGANWWGTAAKPAGGNWHYRSMILWNWVDPRGKIWPQHTYSRNYWASDEWADGGLVGNTITLKAPWTGGSFPAGHPVSNGSSGGSYMYMPSCANTVIPEAWTTFSDVFTAGIMPISTTPGVLNQFTWNTGLPPGTAQIKVGWLLNATPSPANPTVGKHALASVSFSDASAAQGQAFAAYERWAPTGYASIDGGKITADTIGAIQIAAESIDTTNIATAGLSAVVIKFGTMSGDRIAVNTINSGHVVTAGLDAGVIKFGIMSGDRLQANSISVGKLTVTSMDNLVEDPRFANDLGSGMPWGAAPTGFSVVAGTGRVISGVAGRALQIVTSSVGQAARVISQATFPAEPGQSYKLGAWVKSSVAAPAAAIKIQMWTAKADGSTAAWIQVPTPALAANVWTWVPGMVTTPSLTVRASTSIQVESNAPVGTIWVDFVQNTRAADASLVVDGSINTGHVVTTGLDAQVIKFGTMSGDRITVNTINSGHIVTTGLDAAVIKFGVMHGSRIQTGTLYANQIVVGASDPTLLLTYTSNDAQTKADAAKAAAASYLDSTMSAAGIRWTRNLTGTVTETSPGTFRKTTGTGAWDSQVYSTEGYVSGAFVSGTSEAQGVAFFIGLNSDPAADANVTGIDYAWFASGANVWQVYENGAVVVDVGARAVGDVASIIHDGNNVRYYLNGVLKRTVVRGAGAALYLDTSFHTVGPNGVKNLQFGPLSPDALSAISEASDKAAAAQAAAISTAAADATSKANAALAGALAVDQASYGGLSSNPTFDKWVGTTPDDTSLWSGAVIKETTIVQTAPNAARFNNLAGAEHGLFIGSALTAKLPPASPYITVILDFYLVSGGVGGAGVVVDWNNTLGTTHRVNVHLADYVATPEVGKWYRLTKTVKRPANWAGTPGSIAGYLMGGWNGFVSPAANVAKNIIFDRLDYRVASPEEIAAYEAAGDATSKANAAQQAAISDASSKYDNAKLLTESWAYPATTEINGAYLRTGTVAANQIVVGGGDTTPILTAASNDAQTKASAAQAAAINTAAADATGKANAAQAAAISDASQTKSLVGGWVYGGTTKINGGNIQADTVSAVQLDANAINGKTITGATFRTAAPGTARMEVLYDPSYGYGCIRWLNASGSLNGILYSGAGAVSLGWDLGTGFSAQPSGLAIMFGADAKIQGSNSITLGSLGTPFKHFRTGRYNTGNANASGQFTIPHGLGTTPQSVALTPANGWHYAVVNMTSSVITVQMRGGSANGTILTAPSTSPLIDCYWQVWA